MSAPMPFDHAAIKIDQRSPKWYQILFYKKYTKVSSSPHCYNSNRDCDEYINSREENCGILSIICVHMVWYWWEGNPKHCVKIIQQSDNSQYNPTSFISSIYEEFWLTIKENDSLLECNNTLFGWISFLDMS